MPGGRHRGRAAKAVDDFCRVSLTWNPVTQRCARLSSVPATPPETIAPRAAYALVPMMLVAPPLMAVSPATVGVAVPLYALAWIACVPRGIAWRAPAAWFMLAVAAWGVISAQWALDGELARDKAIRFALVATPIAWWMSTFAAGPPRAIVLRAVLAGGALAALLLAVQTFGDFVLRSVVTGPLAVPAALKTNVPAAALVVFAWILPAVATRVTGRLRALAFVTWVLVGLCAWAGDGIAPRLAFGAGVGVFLLAWRWPRACAVLLVAMLAASHVAAPRLLAHGFAGFTRDHSLWHRMEVWAFTGETMAARPWFGVGFANSRAVPAGDGTFPLTGARREIPMYPHNALLQAQLELGVVGVVLCYGALIALLRLSLAAARVPRAAALAGIAAALAVWSVGYPLWRSTWLAWLWVAAISWRIAAARADGATCHAS